MTVISKNVDIDKLGDIVNKCNNKYQTTIKINLNDVKSSTYIVFDVENNDKNSDFKIGDHVRVSKYKKIFAQGTNQIDQKRFL